MAVDARTALWLKAKAEAAPERLAVASLKCRSKFAHLATGEETGAEEAGKIGEEREGEKGQRPAAASFFSSPGKSLTDPCGIGARAFPARIRASRSCRTGLVSGCQSQGERY